MFSWTAPWTIAYGWSRTASSLLSASRATARFNERHRQAEQLRNSGRHLCTLLFDPNIGKMLLMGSFFRCLNPALTIAATLAYRDPFVFPINKKEEADAAKRSFAGDSCGDHIALLKAYEGWKDAKRQLCSTPPLFRQATQQLWWSYLSSLVFPVSLV
nr:DExH-box ATP-dependent RNA helicase DExH1 isoform X2 [Ipomoea batatas]